MHILIAEDDRHLRASVVRGLRESAATVDQTGNGAQAIALALANTYDAIVLDILLPGKSGLEACKALRDQGSRVPILMLTALDTVEQRIAGLDAGADDYLVKPFDFGELLARLRALIRRSSDPQAPLITVGDLTIEPFSRQVTRGGREITLTATEFDLLLLLARNRGRVVPRAELLKEVWGESNSYSNIIDVYASRLRRKIDEGEETPLFTTMRGVGFILREPDKAPRKSTARRAPRR